MLTECIHTNYKSQLLHILVAQFTVPIHVTAYEPVLQTMFIPFILLPSGSSVRGKEGA